MALKPEHNATVDWGPLLIGAVYRAAERLDVAPEDVALWIVAETRRPMYGPGWTDWILHVAGTMRAELAQEGTSK
jgi:hypothetical protein